MAIDPKSLESWARGALGNAYCPGMSVTISCSSEQAGTYVVTGTRDGIDWEPIIAPAQASESFFWVDRTAEPNRLAGTYLNASGTLTAEALEDVIRALGLPPAPAAPRNTHPMEATMENPIAPPRPNPVEWEENHDFTPNSTDVSPGVIVVVRVAKTFHEPGHEAGELVAVRRVGGRTICHAGHNHGPSWLHSGNKVMRRRKAMAKPNKVEVGQRWRVTRASERHAAGEILTITSMPSMCSVKTDRCGRDCAHGDVYFTSDDYGHCEFVGLIPVTPFMREPQQSPNAPHTSSDVRGWCARADIPDAVAGCRLGCACPVHRPTRPEPWVPSVDDYDLLPDA